MTNTKPPSSGTEAPQAPTREDVAARLAATQERRAEEEQAQEHRRGKASSVSVGMRIGIELVASVLVGAGLGWFADNQLNTSPIFLLAMVSLGFTAGVFNVVRISKGLDERQGIGRIRAKTPNENAADQPARQDD